MRVQNSLRVLSKDTREANIVNADAKLSFLEFGNTGLEDGKMHRNGTLTVIGQEIHHTTLIKRNQRNQKIRNQNRCLMSKSAGSSDIQNTMDTSTQDTFYPYSRDQSLEVQVPVPSPLGEVYALSNIACGVLGIPIFRY